MDRQSLVSIAQRAILQVLNYHFPPAKNGGGLSALDQQTRNQISADIRKNLPLVAHAQDRNKAHLEIVCDAALAVAEKYQIKKRWFYAAVQGLTSMELVPGLYKDAADPLRLSTIDAQDEAGITSSEEEEEAVAEDAAQDPRRPWTDADMVELIELKFKGMTAKAIAKKTSRSHGSVHCTWLNAAGDTEKKWFQYIHEKFGARENKKDANGESGSTSLGKRKRASSL